ncbi:MAG: response regulator transcription factor [Rhodospirillales bacterium]|nr:response regulator transcription factor [Rhodospirillales bacterium]
MNLPGDTILKMEKQEKALDRNPVVYIVDDDQAVRHSLEWLLGDGEFEVRTFASAIEFLDTLDPMQPGCLVADVRMPGMSGLELQHEIKARGIDLPVIIITGHSDRNMALRAMSAGAVNFLEKPLNDEMLIAMIRKALGESPNDGPSAS